MSLYLTGVALLRPWLGRDVTYYSSTARLLRPIQMRGLSLIHISEPRDGLLSRMPSSA